jgi:surface protein
MDFMFQQAWAFNQNISSWNVTSVTDHYNFSTGSSLSVENIPVWA